MLNLSQRSRLPSLLEGGITIDGQAAPIPCTVRDLSATGARIWLQDVTKLTNEFNLTISLLGQTVPARPVWFQDRTVGIMFTKVLNSPAVPKFYSRSVQTSGLKTELGTEPLAPSAAACSSDKSSLVSFRRSATNIL